MNSLPHSKKESPEKHLFHTNAEGSQQKSIYGFRNLLVHHERKGRDSIIINDFPIFTPRKERDGTSNISITPLSIVRKMHDYSPGLTTLTKKRPYCANSHTDLWYMEGEYQKPKASIPSFHNLFQRTGEKPNENFVLPKMDSLEEIIPLEKTHTFQPSNFFEV